MRTNGLPLARNLGRWNAPKSSYASLGDFLINPRLSSGLHSVMLDNYPLDMLLSARFPGRRLVVFFHGAFNQSKSTLPNFVGTSLGAQAQANTLSISDPSLYASKNLRLGWFAGCNLQHVLPLVIQKVIESIGAAEPIFFGSSGGGFPALLHAMDFKESLSIVNSATTTISRHPERSTLVADFLRHSLGAESDEDERRALSGLRSADIPTSFDYTHSSRVIFFQNIGDKSFLRHHFLPFVHGAGIEANYVSPMVSNSSNVAVVQAYWHDGHAYPPRGLLHSLLEGASDSDVPLANWATLEALMPLARKEWGSDWNS